MPSSGTVTGRSGNKWKQTRHDKYYFLAKEQGYRSRASFKLIQMNKKFNFLEGANAVLDLCAAPGGWLQVCQKYMPTGAKIIGVDILPIKKIPNVKTFCIDITTEDCRVALKKELADTMVDLVVHDGAPNIGGATWSRDAYQQIELVVHSLKLSTHFLRAGGSFVTKVFRSQDYNALLWVLKQFFKQITVTKPESSRNASAEIFVVCEHYLAPKKIDPKLLDPAYIFASPESAGADKVVDVFHEKLGKRNRQGYADDAGALLISRGTVAEFIDGANPIEVLGAYNSLEWDENSEIYLNHTSTTDEVKELCKDLKVLGKGDFSYLLKWRKKLVQYKKDLMKEEQGEEEEEEAEKEKELTEAEKAELEEQKLTEQLEELKDKAAADRKREKKKKRQKLNKERKKKELNANNANADVAEGEEGMFELGAMRDSQTLDHVRTTKEGVLAEDALREEWSGPSEDEISDGSDSESRADKMERDLDFAYSQYKKRRNLIFVKKKKLDLDDEGGEEDEGDEGDMSSDAEEEEEEENQNPLLMKLGEKASKPTKADVLARWFERDAFKDVARGASKTTKTTKGQVVEDSSDDSDDEERPTGFEEEEEEESEEEERPAKKRKKATQKKKTQAKAAAVAAPTVTANEEDKDDSDFEEVEMSEYSSDSDAQAETLAMGTMMLRKKKKIDMIESAYNRYAFNDDDLLPDWFADEEMRHNKGTIPITKEMVEAFKQQQKSIDARSSKKVLEAQQRKRKKALKSYEKLKAKASKLAESSETTFKDKMKMFEQLAKKKGMKEKKRDRTYVVSRKGGGQAQTKAKAGKGATGPTKLVDSRMKADSRGKKSAESRKSRDKKSRNKKKARQANHKKNKEAAKGR